MNNNEFSILIVDDTPKNLQVLGNTLKLSNYKVEFAINGFRALEWIEKQPFDLLLLDVMMPEMDGYQVCEKIRSNNKFNNLPIIFLTAKTDEESIVKGFKLGAQDYITKPFNTQELLVRVETQLELKSNREKLESLNKWLETEVQKRTQQLKEANEKLEKANEELTGLDEAKTEFLSIISNEMRTPLNGILGTMHVLKDQVSSKELVQLIAVLDASVNKLEKFSSYALHLTALKTKKQMLHVSTLKLADQIEATVIELAELQKQYKVSINNLIDDNCQINIDHDLWAEATKLVLESFIKRSAPEHEVSVKCVNNKQKQKIVFAAMGNKFSDDFLNQNFEKKDPKTQSYNPEGLDYNLVKLIVEVHQGILQLKNTTEGIQLTVEL